MLKIHFPITNSYSIYYFIFLNNYHLLNNTWYIHRPKTSREADLGIPVLVHLICPGKLQMSNYQIPEYTLQNTKNIHHNLI
jgi:hypothetical protein